MGTGFLAEGGPSLGMTAHGHHDFQFTDDVVRKVHIGHYTFYSAAIIRDHTKISLAEDIVAMGYIDGENVTFCQGPEDFQMLLSDADNAKGTILVKMTPYNRGLPASPQDIAGRWNPTIVEQCIDTVKDPNKVHGDSSYFYSFVYKLDKINQGMAMRDPGFTDVINIRNTTCWRGHHNIFDPNRQNFDTKILDDGLFGHNVYKGCISDRDITGRAIKDMGFERHHIFS